MNSYPKELKARILLHRRISPDYFRLQLACPEIARSARPGQFLMLRINGLQDPFLRRPFGFSRIFPPREKKRKPTDEGWVEICYQTVGRGTQLMTQLQEGERLDLLGPLGNGFWTEEGCRRTILVGGGIGVAPLLAWAQEMRKAGVTKKKSGKTPVESPELVFLIGAKNKDKVLGAGECRRWGIEAQAATEDGSLGIQGTATDLLEKELMTGRHSSTAIYACGPNPMLARVAQVAEQFDLPCQVLLESRMACGVGACLGCTVKYREELSKKEGQDQDSALPPEGSNSTAEGEERANREGAMPVISEAPPFRYARVCKEGPVFNARKIFWD
jgi:dihydroorotate dehydrogenase electron transfer subunit